MQNERQQQLEAILFDLLPLDGSAVGNGQLSSRFEAAAAQAGLSTNADDFGAARAALLAGGVVIKGRGRGGSTARSTSPAGGAVSGEPAADQDADATPFELEGGELSVAQAGGPSVPAKAKAATPKLAGAPSPAPGAEVLSYRHPDRRTNNPEVGLVNEASDPQQPKQKWTFDPHFDPVLNFDSARADLERLVDDALASGDETAMRAVLEEIRRRGAPYLQWTGKAERNNFEVDTVSLHVHERIDPMSILAAVRQRLKDEQPVGAKAAPKAAQAPRQASLFEAPFEALPLRDAIDFYKHDKGWANRLVSGDSLQVMNSLLMKEGMAGRVQMIYIDPPYGIKYGSNFQPFVGKRDVKDRSDADLTQEPEMIKAFRDTWELGIHSYLTYLRDRLLLARELLSDSGSVFVQISDENVHLVRNLLDEIFGIDNFCSQIVFRKTTGKGGELLDATCDFLIWYGKDKKHVKFHPEYEPRGPQDDYNLRFVELADGRQRAIKKQEIDDSGALPLGARVFRPNPITSARPPMSNDLKSFDFNGKPYSPGTRTFSTDERGLSRLNKAGRLTSSGNTLGFIRYLDDFPFKPGNDIWDDTRQSGFADSKVYVVQTAVRAVERCIQMTTDPGDLILDPTCGSGTTAYVAEKWGRRWITCDTSRVAVTLAKQRLMTASFDYYELKYPNEGLKGGFIYQTVPHVTLKSIANNADIDAIHERLHPAILNALGELNAALKAHAPGEPYLVGEGARKGVKLVLGLAGQDLQEWEVPFDAPATWPAELHAPLAAFHAARQAMQKQMDASIAAHADQETLYDQPERSKAKLRITGPFTVEAVPFPTVLSLESAEGDASAMPTDDTAYQASIARSGETSRQQQWRDELLKTGIRGKGGQMLRFAELAVMAGTTCLHAIGTLADSGERVVVSFGPEHGALEQRQVEHALGEAGELFPLPKMIVFCAFAFDPEAAKDIDAVKGITSLKAQMNTDLLTEDLKKARASNQSFWLMGQPDVALTAMADGAWQVEVNGFDYFDTIKGELISGGKAKIAMWSLDTDYDGRSLFPHQVFFPMAGKDEGWRKLKKSIRAELDESLLDQFHGTVSLPFQAGKHGKAAVKIVDDRGIESLKIIALVAPK
ncbi:MAG: site-specific DNA-methyltransferase [Leptothrix sp. (in: b-proteobacteria)]